MASEPRTISAIRRAIEEARLADVGSGFLESAIPWALRNDPDLLVDIEDELAFRSEA